MRCISISDTWERFIFYKSTIFSFTFDVKLILKCNLIYFVYHIIVCTAVKITNNNKTSVSDLQRALRRAVRKSAFYAHALRRNKGDTQSGQDER